MKTKVKYKGLEICRSRDFGTRGNKGRCALIVVAPKFNTNVSPGGVWYHSVREAMTAIDCLMEQGFNPDKLINEIDSYSFHLHPAFQAFRGGVKHEPI